MSKKDKHSVSLYEFDFGLGEWPQNETEYECEYYDCVFFCIKLVIVAAVIVFAIQGCLCMGH